MTTKNNLLEGQPVSDMQLNQLEIRWVPIGNVKPNAYNPNKMTPNERVLLRQSLLEDGWTQPIVTLKDGVIVDGEQRWTAAQMPITLQDVQDIIDKMIEREKNGHPVSESIVTRLELSKKRLVKNLGDRKAGVFADLTGGLVPITVLELGDDAHKMISTIRHNRARGVHQSDALAGITQDLIKLGLDIDDLESRLGMTDEEVDRFMQIAGGQDEAFDELLQNEDYARALVVKGFGELDPEVRDQIEMSSEANEAYRAQYNVVRARKKEVEEKAAEEIKVREKNGDRGLTQSEKIEIQQEVSRQFQPLEKPKKQKIKKVMLYVLPEEYKIVEEALGQTEIAINFVKACRAIIDHRKTFDKWMEALE